MRVKATLALVVGSWFSNLLVARADAPAAAPPAADVESARGHFQKGVRLYKERSFDAALAEFERAYELAPDYRILYNLGQVQMERHDYVAALERFREYLKRGGAALTAGRRAEVDSQLTDLAGLVASLTVVVEPEGADLVVDGVSVGTLPIRESVLVNAGVHNVAVRKAGYAPAQRTITVAGGDRQRLNISLDREAALDKTEASDLLAPRVREVPNRTRLWISVAAAGALGLTAGILAVRANSIKTEFDNDLNTFPGDAHRIAEDRSRLRLYAGLTDGFGVAALVAGAFATYFALSEGPSPPRTEHAAGPRLHLAGDPSGVRLVGEF